MDCCANCFEDRIIINFINQHGVIGDCDYCNSEGAQVIRTSALYNSHFHKLESYYEVSQHGEHYIYDLVDNITGFGDSLYNLLLEDWQIFPDGKGENILYDIMNENKDAEIGETIDESVSFSTVVNAFTYRDGSDLWNTFSRRLVNENRFFPNEELDNLTTLEELYSLLKNLMKKYTVPILSESTLYRARIGQYTDFRELKAPPFEKVLKGGRANPVGISVLYCAETPETAISEVRPWKSAEITVASIQVKKDLILVDLSKIEKLNSPFISNDLLGDLASRNLLLNLHEMLSRPINPNTSEIEYIPSQFLTEFIKSLGYDGLIFKSSLGLNNNLVVFDESQTTIISLAYYEVSDIRISYGLIKQF